METVEQKETAIPSSTVSTKTAYTKLNQEPDILELLLLMLTIIAAILSVIFYGQVEILSSSYGRVISEKVTNWPIIFASIFAVLWAWIFFKMANRVKEANRRSEQMEEILIKLANKSELTQEIKS